MAESGVYYTQLEAEKANFGQIYTQLVAKMPIKDTQLMAHYLSTNTQVVADIHPTYGKNTPKHTQLVAVLRPTDGRKTPNSWQKNTQLKAVLHPTYGTAPCYKVLIDSKL